MNKTKYLSVHTVAFSNSNFMQSEKFEIKYEINKIEKSCK